MGKEISKQFQLQPQAIGISSGILFSLGLIPGLPHFPFIAMAGVLGIAAHFIAKEQKKQESKKLEEVQKAAAVPQVPEQVENLLSLVRLELEVGYGLIPLVDEEQRGDLLNRIRSVRRQFATELGIIIPPLRVRDNLQLRPGEYRILIKGNEVAKGEMMPGYVMALNPGEIKTVIEGIPTKEPVFQLPALWIPEKRKDEAQLAGYTVVDISTIITTNLTEILRAHADELLSRQDVQKLLDRLSQNYPKVVEELVPQTIPMGILQKVLQNLLKERISIRDLLTILETIADYVPISKDPDILTEYVRQRLGRSIVKPYETPEGVLPLISIDQKIEDILREGIQKSDHGSYLSLDPSTAQKILISINQTLEKVGPANTQPVILCSPTIRRHLKKLLDRFLPHVVVLSHNELSTLAKIQSLGTVTLHAN
jgi:flagellar biosynthesis protein FlhA